MSDLSFDDFINQQTKMTEQCIINWKERIVHWEESINNFNEMVESYMKPYVEAEKVRLKKREIHTEECIGSYDVPTLDLFLPQAKITFNPLRINADDVKGRIDMIGPHGAKKFILVPKDSFCPNINLEIRIGSDETPKKEEDNILDEWVWKMSTPPPMVTYLDIEEDAFKTALMDIVNG